MNIWEKIKVIFVGRKAIIIRSKVDEWLENNISKCFITGVIEMTNGLNFTSNLYNALPNFTLLLISFLLGFGGISVLFQVYSIIAKENISIKPYFYGKILQGFLSVIFTSIFIFL